jgi:hypothetical protein
MTFEGQRGICMASTKLSRLFGRLRRYPRTATPRPTCERSPEQMIRDFEPAVADEPSQDRLLDSLRSFDETLRTLEQGWKPSSERHQRN